MDVVRPLEDSGLLAATLSAGPRKWQGVAILPARKDGHIKGKGKQMAEDGEVNGSEGFELDDGNKWQNTGQRLRDIRANRGTYRRLDLKFVFLPFHVFLGLADRMSHSLAPMGSRGAALLALSGDVDFVRTCRINATKLGMHLNEFGLWRWNESLSPPPLSVPNRRNTKHAKEKAKRDREEAERRGNMKGWWELVQGESEEGILRSLGRGGVPPEKRNYRFLTSRR